MVEVKEAQLTDSAHLSVLDLQLRMIEKQVRMITELVDAAPVTMHPEGAVSIISQQRVIELLALLKREIQIAQIAVTKAADKGHGL